MSNGTSFNSTKESLQEILKHTANDTFHPHGLTNRKWIGNLFSNLTTFSFYLFVLML
jgi:hypothetical protein